MKCFNELAVLVVGVLTFSNIQANPILIKFFNELTVDSGGWVIEAIDPYVNNNLDGWFLTSETDTAFFKPGIEFTSTYLLITPDSLQNSLYINPIGDIIELHEPDSTVLDSITFGEVTPSQIAAPLPGQSICLRDYYNGCYDYCYYLDNTPTLGMQNDALNANGRLEGFITNQSGQPLPMVKIIYDYWDDMGYLWTMWTSTDTNGYFDLTDYAQIEKLEISRENYQTKHLGVQIWPEDTVTIDITMDSIIVALPLEPDDAIAGFELKQNYPNPFNPLTTIEFTLPMRSRVSLTIYNLAGETVSIPVSGELSPGIYRVQWDGSKMASGLYFYRLQAEPQSGEENRRGIFTDTQKMMLLK